MQASCFGGGCGEDVTEQKRPGDMQRGVGPLDESEADETTGGVTTSYTMNAAGNLVSQKKGSVRSYYLMDKLGSVVGLTDSSGNVAQRFEYDPFGKLLTTSITTDSSFKYASGYYDTANKLYKFGERYYDPAIAAWTQRDTLAGSIDDPETMNRYTYVGGDPIQYVDPTGRALSDSCAFNVAAATTGAVATSLGVGRTLTLTVFPEPGVSKLAAAASAAGTAWTGTQTVAAMQDAKKTC